MSAPRPHVAIWKRLLLVAGVALVVAVLAIGYSAFKTWQLLPESYAAWTTGNLRVEYLQTHTNEWPRDWEDLRAATNSLLEKGMPVYSPLDRLPALVRIDWQVDVNVLSQTARSDSNATIQAVTRLDGSPLPTLWGSDTEPNGKIMRYLQKQ